MDGHITSHVMIDIVSNPKFIFLPTFGIFLSNTPQVPTSGLVIRNCVHLALNI
jgi:hypothetical protein